MKRRTFLLSGAAVTLALPALANTAPVLKVLKSPTCGCCTAWVDYVRQAGFTVEADAVPDLRGLVDLFDGGRHLYQCLIIASEPEAGERRYDFKRNTAASDSAPLDHYREPEAPVGLLPRL